MPYKSKLQQAVEKQAANLDPAQREFVMAELRTYLWNERNQKRIEKNLESGIVDEDGFRDFDAEGKLFRQRHQIVTEQASLFNHMMRELKGTSSEDDELDLFLK